MESIDTVLSNPSFFVDPDNPDPEAYVNDVIAASSVKRKRQTHESEEEDKSSGNGFGIFNGTIELTGELSW